MDKHAAQYKLARYVRPFRLASPVEESQEPTQRRSLPHQSSAPEAGAAGKPAFSAPRMAAAHFRSIAHHASPCDAQAGQGHERRLTGQAPPDRRATVGND